MTEHDLAGVKRIRDEAGLSPWTHDQLLVEVRDHVARVAELNELAGYAFARIGIGEMEIMEIAVSPGKRRKGIGRELVNDLDAMAQSLGLEKLFLEVRVSNTAACQLYERSGFQKCGLRKGYYPDGEDALLMQKIPGPA